MRWIKIAQSAIKGETVLQCWKKTGLLDGHSGVDIQGNSIVAIDEQENVKIQQLLNEHVRYIVNDSYVVFDFYSELVAEQEATHPIDEENIFKVIDESEHMKYKSVDLSRQNAEQEQIEEVEEERFVSLPTIRKRIMHLNSVIQFLDDHEERVKNDLRIIRNRLRQSLFSILLLKINKLFLLANFGRPLNFKRPGKNK